MSARRSVRSATRKVQFRRDKEIAAGTLIQIGPSGKIEPYNELIDACNTEYGLVVDTDIKPDTPYEHSWKDRVPEFVKHLRKKKEDDREGEDYWILN